MDITGCGRSHDRQRILTLHLRVRGLRKSPIFERRTCRTAKRIAIIYKKHAGREESPPCSEMSSSPREPSGLPYPRQASSGNLSSNSGDAQDELHKAKSMWGSFSPKKSTSGEIVCLESPISVASSADPFEEHDAAQVGTPLFKQWQL